MRIAKEKLRNNPKVIYEDEDIVVLDKPAGVIVNRSATAGSSPTLQDIVGNMYPHVFSTDSEHKDSFFFKRTGMVHRLDKDTSGLIVFALNPDAFEFMLKQFLQRNVHKKYSALSYGTIVGANEGDEIEVNANITRSPRNREKFAIAEKGREAITIFKIKKVIHGKYGKFTLFDCFPRTGRTHQIRVHLTAMNTPIVGDKLYSGRKRIKKYSSIFPRQMLHASELSFPHPSKGEFIRLTSPFPRDFRSVLDLLQEN